MYRVPSGALAADTTGNARTAVFVLSSSGCTGGTWSIVTGCDHVAPPSVERIAITLNGMSGPGATAVAFASMKTSTSVPSGCTVMIVGSGRFKGAAV